MTASRGQSPRSGSPGQSWRGRSLDTDLRNAPCYHAAIMRLLPSSMRRALTLHRPPAPSSAPALPPSHHHRHHRHRHGHRHYRRDWRCNLSVRPPPPPLSPPAHPDPSLKIAAHAPLAGPPSPSNRNPSFRSGTVYLEVKLAELLGRRCKTSLEGAPMAPSMHCFGVCWQLLGELSRMKTPFARAFSVIAKELDKSIHSSYLTVKDGSTIGTFHFVPYFELTCKLQDQKMEIEAERENLKADVLACEAEIGHVEQEIEVIFIIMFDKEMFPNESKIAYIQP